MSTGSASEALAPLPAPRRPSPAGGRLRGHGGSALGRGAAGRLPVGACPAPAGSARWQALPKVVPPGFWQSVSSPEAVAALKFTLMVSAIVVAINALFGTLIAWVLVRDKFPGKRIVNALIDLPFALPTIVAGVVLLALYGRAARPASISRSRAPR